MKSAYGIQINEFPSGANISFPLTVKYFCGNRETVHKFTTQQRFATPMTEQCAKELAAKLRLSTKSTVTVIGVLADDDVYLPRYLEELNQGGPTPTEAEPAGLRDLKIAIERCFKDGLSQLDILAAANKAVLG
jgi:hypothetical protein